MNKLSKEYPEILLTIADVVAQALIEKGKLSDAEAAELGIRCADALRHSFGGDTVYIPKGIMFEYSKRDVELVEMLKTSTMREVCDKYGITQRRIYQILKAVKDGLPAPEQLTFDMFDL